MVRVHCRMPGSVSLYWVHEQPYKATGETQWRQGGKIHSYSKARGVISLRDSSYQIESNEARIRHQADDSKRKVAIGGSPVVFIMSVEIKKCELCQMEVETRKHHLIPKSKGGKETIDCCFTCENYLHKTWSHNQLRDVYNSVEVILADEGFQKFLKWRRKQSATTLFKSVTGRNRNKRKYS